MNNLLLTLICALLLVRPAAAQQQFNSPEDLLGTLYSAYMLNGVSNLEPYFSDRLAQEMGNARLSPEILASMGVDPLVGAEGGNLTLLKIESDTEDEERVVGTVTFHNRLVPVHLTFELVNEAVEGWQIDHLSGVSGKITWCSQSLIAAAKKQEAQPAALENR